MFKVTIQRWHLTVLTLMAVLLVPLVASGRDLVAQKETSDKPIVIGHRGASGYRPEHTLAAYELAIDMGADYVEPDLVTTKDGHLIARHDNELSLSTDVADHPEFANRKTTKVVDGYEISGWFTEDFTLREIKTLRAKERIPHIRQHNTLYNGRYEVPTLQEVIDLVRSKERELGRTIGIYPETKHPLYFDNLGLSMEERLVEILHKNGYEGPDAPVYIQSFDVLNLIDLNTMTDVPIVQLVWHAGGPVDVDFSYAHMVTPEGLADIAEYADGVGPSNQMVIPLDDEGNLAKPTDLVKDAHAVGLLVHSYTFRNENAFLPPEFRSSDDPSEYGDAFSMYESFFKAGIDGLFSDNPDTALEARDSFFK